MIKRKYYIILLITFFALKGCIEPFEVETKTFESALVIDATITNELKHQEIILSRTFKFEENGPIGETGATIEVMDIDIQYQHQFEEKSNGRYISKFKFEAIPNRNYQLFITTVIM